MYLFAIYFCAPKRSLSFKPIELRCVQTNINKSSIRTQLPELKYCCNQMTKSSRCALNRPLSQHTFNFRSVSIFQHLTYKGLLITMQSLWFFFKQIWAALWWGFFFGGVSNSRHVKGFFFHFSTKKWLLKMLFKVNKKINIHHSHLHSTHVL